MSLRAVQRTCAASLRGAMGRGMPGAASRGLVRTPVARASTELAMAMPRGFSEYPNEVLLMLSHQGSEGAIREQLTREIMCVDEVTWEEAQPKLEEISKAAQAGLWFYKLPYRVGIATAVLAGFGSIPMCFDLNTALWFNEGWMEPPLGQLSFFLLTLQYTRMQMRNIGMKPYTELIHERRAKNLKDKYPQYDRNILGMFSNVAFCA